MSAPAPPTLEPRTAAPRPAESRTTTPIRGKYMSLTSYRREGSPVATPVWFVEEGGILFAITGEDSYKARRIRRNPNVAVAECTARGALRGEPIPARAEFLPESEHARVDRLMSRKYRLDRIVVLPVYRLAMRLSGRATAGTGTGAYLAITPARDRAS